MPDIDVKDDGGPAFPCKLWSNSTAGYTESAPGMPLRDYFAGQALAGYMSVDDQRTCPKSRVKEIDTWRQEMYDGDAQFMYLMADAMIKARNA